MAAPAALAAPAAHPMILPEKPEGHDVAHRTLLGMTAVTAVLSLIPPLRFGASLALRGISLLSLGVSTISASKTGPLLHLAKVAAVALGIVGLAAFSPSLMIASVATDMGAQVLGFVQAIQEGEDWKGSAHLGMLVIDLLTLLGFVFGAWGLMVSAAVITAAFMGPLVMVEGGRGNLDVALALFTLACVGVAGAITTAEYTRRAKEVTVKNGNPDQTLVVVHNQHEYTSQKGEDLVFPTGYFGNYRVYHNTPDGVWSEVCSVPREVYESALDPAMFGTLPLGGQTVTAVEEAIPLRSEMINMG